MSKKRNRKNNSQKSNNEIMSNANKELVQLKEIPSLFTCVFKHTVASSTAEFKYEGPKIPLAEWQRVLAFFKWTFMESRSESQVRLFVNTITKDWKAWAFPQKANTGMAANELDTDETKVQRAQFKESEGWYYFGTIHHHCSAGAFQSGVDENNEINQDGIHITVGNMDKGHYDIHERFYLGGFKLTSFSLVDLWEIATDLSAVPAFLLSKLPPDTAKLMVRHEMGNPAPEGTEFPEQWKANLIVERPVVVTHSNVMGIPQTWPGNGGGYQPAWLNQSYTKKAAGNLMYDRLRAIDAINDYCKEHAQNLTFDEAVEMIAEMTHFSDDHLNLIGFLVQNDVLPDDMVNHFLESEMKASDKTPKNGDSIKDEEQARRMSTRGQVGSEEYWWGQ